MVVGAMEKVNITVIPSVVKSFIESYVKDNSLENVKVVSRPAVPKGNNFMGIIDRVTVAGVKNGKDTEINVIVKMPISDEALHHMFSLHLFFRREIYIYNNIAKLYDNLQRNLPDAEKFKFPKCFFTNSAKPAECIILEDLVNEGFEVHHRLKRVDFEHMSLAMEAIGKMHAMSFYVQENMKEKSECFKRALDDVVGATFCPEGKEVL